MKVGDQVKVWGAVMETEVSFCVAMQYGKNICTIDEIREYDGSKILLLSYASPDGDPEDAWCGWVHEKQIESL